MADKLSDDFKDSAHNQINWIKVIGFRNIIAHNYFGIDAEEVWEIIYDSLPMLQNNVKLTIGK